MSDDTKQIEIQHTLNESTGTLFPIQFVQVGDLSDVPAPLVRISTCGGMRVEVLHEVLSTNPPQGRYVIVTPQQRRRGSTTGRNLLSALVSLPGHYAAKSWLTERLCRYKSEDDEDDDWPGMVRVDNIVTLLRGLLCPPGIAGEKELRKALVSYVLNRFESGSGYQLAGEPLLWLDVDVIEASVKEACLLEKQGQDALPVWERAHVLASRGGYLLDERYSDWAESKRREIEGYQRQAVHALHRLYLAHKGEAAEEQVLLLLRSYWQAHITDEDVLRPLLEVLGKRGCFQEAEEYYQRLCQELEVEGLTPNARTQSTIQNMRSEPQHEHNLLQTSESASSLHASPAPHLYQPDGTLAPFSHAIIEMVRELEGAIHLDASRRRLFQQTLSLVCSVSSPTLAASVTDLLSSLLDDGVSFYSTAIPACWNLVYNGGIDHVEKMLPIYLAHLSVLTQQPSQDRTLAARLASQGYKLANLLDLRREDFGAALQHSKNAFLYGQIAEDSNLQVAALIEEALTFQYRKRLPQTLASYQKAFQVADDANGISPIIKGRVYGGLAVACARLGRKQEALRYIGLAYETFPDHPENDVHFSYTHYSHYYLYLYEGIMYTELHQPENALAAYAHFHGTEYASRRIEIANKEAASLLIAEDLDQCCDKVERAATLSLSQKSDLRYSEAREIYQGMDMKWPHEQKVKDLAQIFQQ